MVVDSVDIVKKKYGAVKYGKLWSFYFKHPYSKMKFYIN